MARHLITLADLAAQPWAIEPSVGNALAMQLAHQPLSLDYADEDSVVYEYDWSWFPKAEKPGSIAVLSIKGGIYDYYAQYLCGKLDAIYADKNMAGLLVRLSSPGGQSSAGWRIADKLMQAPFPTAARIDYGMAASAGCMIGAACDGFYAGRSADMVGSIGTYITWQDFSEYFKKNGIVIKDLYADQSTEKNAESRAAEKGNYEPLRAIATAEATRFIEFIQSRCPDLNAANKHILKGAMLMADQAVADKLLDGIASEKEIIAALRGKSASLTISSTRTDMPFGYHKVTALAALAGLASTALTDELIEAAQAELTAMGITNCTLVTQAQFEAAASAPDPAALSASQAEVARLTTELATTKNTLTTTQTSLSTAQAEVTRLGGQAGAAPTTTTNAADPAPDAGEGAPKLNYTFDSLSGMDHLVN